MLAEAERSGRRRRIGVLVAMVWVLAVLVAGGAGLFTDAGAASYRASGSIDAYDIELTLEPSGALRVREEILYRQGPDELHGFRRFVPIVVDYDDAHSRLYRISDVSASAEPAQGGTVTSGDPDAVSEVATAVDNDHTVIRIGSASTFITGQWRYSIDYVVHDTVETVDVANVGTIEELAWNVVGTQWDIPIRQLSVAINLPSAPMNVACYQGPFGAADPCPLRQDGERLELSIDALDAFDAVTVYTDFPEGSIEDATAVLREKWTLARAFAATPYTLGGSALATALVSAGVGTLLARQGRDRRLALNAYLPTDAEPETAGLAGFFEKPDGPVQFRPPEGMTPGLCGVLVDEKADALDVSATIVDLAVRGYLRIEQVGEGSGRKSDFNIRFLKGADQSLTAYEAKLLGHLQAAASGDAVRLSALRTTFSSQLAEVRKALYDETMQRRWFRRRPDRVRGMWAAVGIGALLAGGAVALVLVLFTSLGLFSLPLVLPGLMILATANRMPSRTASGRQMLELVVGYERFLDVADAEELRFAERQYDYVAGLPYAMVFGITERWAKVLSVLQEQGVNLAPTWYVPINPGGPFRYDDFGHSMSDFGSVAAAALSAPQPSSSGGGFSGGGFSGGFSGGGGGGGGGGGW